MTSPVREMVAGLWWKYRELERLLSTRLARQATGASSFPVEEASLRRRDMQALARRFPGSLRELERTTLDALARRAAVLQAIDGLPEDQKPAALAAHPWIETVWRYHLALRELLELKRAGLAPGRPSHLAVAKVATERGLSPEVVRAEIMGE